MHKLTVGSLPMTSPREHLDFYVGTSDNDIALMLKELGFNSLDQLYSHIDDDVKMKELDLPEHLGYEDLKNHVQKISEKNNLKTSFIGDGLQDYTQSEIVAKVCAVRGLTTAYTPYQPERSQGTLETLWIYQSTLAAITGFEAINASLYERATCLFEALHCATRIVRGSNAVIVCESIYPGDKEVLETQSKETNLIIHYAPIDKATGKTDLVALEKLVANTEKLAAIAIPQINNFGLIEDFDDMTNICHANKLQAISIIDPIALANSGLKEPVKWGSEAEGADILVAEGQHLTLAPNWGGPGLGIFGIRYNQKNKNAIRSTAGRFIGKAKDEAGRDCKAIILATREQHIRREKATSNICSNQSFIASACGASLLSRGDIGLDQMFKTSRDNAVLAAQALTKFKDVNLKFKGSFYNEFTLEFKKDFDLNQLILDASESNLHIGVNISGRNGVDATMLHISFTDKQSRLDIENLIRFFETKFTQESISNSIANISDAESRVSKYSIPKFSVEDILAYYEKLGNQNLSPDDGIYPLGSCTMKYNPEVNDWAAGLVGFTDTHPQAIEQDVQGNLEITYEIQEQFKKITGLPGCTTQPLAGAQGELVGLKLFQAYHNENAVAEAPERNIILIPRSAHGTNPASATVAGFETKKVNGEQVGIVHIEALENGEMDFEQFKELVKEYGQRIAGVMVTNPNTSGIFETNFKNMSDLIHEVGGLVYMDGANMNAIAGWIDLDKLGVDAVHNNLHKTWSIPHGGGGPGDAIVAVSKKLIDYLPGIQSEKTTDENGHVLFKSFKTAKTIGSIHRHHGNFAHKVRCYTYLKALGHEGVKKMSAVAVLSAKYLYHKLNKTYPILPMGSKDTARMHEFILTLSEDTFKKVADAGTPKSAAIAKVGKLFLDFGFHAPTVAFPEIYGLMLEPTESYSKAELDGFCDVVKTIHTVINEYPSILQTVPHFTPIDKVDELSANKVPVLNEPIAEKFPEVLTDRVEAGLLRNFNHDEIIKKILEAHETKMKVRNRDL